MTDKYENEDEEYDDEEATSESEEEEYEDEAEDAEASDESEEVSETEDSVASWGYEEKKSRFSKEMLAGFAAIGVLVAIFGIVVYKKMPGTGDSAEVAAVPDASLGNPESSLGTPENSGTPSEDDLNDPFRAGAENGVAVSNLGSQFEPGVGDVTSNASPGGSEFGDPSPANNGSTNFGASGVSSETASLFSNQGVGGQGASGDSFGNNEPIGNDPFASNSATPDLFSGQSDPGIGSNEEPPFGSSTVGTSPATDEFGRPLAGNGVSSGQPDTTMAFPGSGSDELVGSTRRDPFGGPDLTGGSGRSVTDSASTEFGTTEGNGSDLFSQDNQFAQNEPNIDRSLNGSLSGNSGSAIQPETPGNSSEFGSSTGSEPFGTTVNNSESLTNDPFGSSAESGTSQPTGLFDRGPETSLSGGGLNESLSTDLSANSGSGNDTLPGSEFGTPQPATAESEFGPLDSGPSTTSSTPFGSDEPFGTSGNELPESPLGSSGTNSPATSNDLFGNPASTASNDPFPSSTSRTGSSFDSRSGLDSESTEPVNLFLETNSQPLNTASNDPFQPPLTSSPDSNSPRGASSISRDPFGNEPVRSGSSTRNQTFASQPANSGSYTVQEGDSYWNISKKVYGTAKYFQVLADHNRKTIADPQKMKTGVVIQTPDAAVLQARLKTVPRPSPTALAGRIETSGRADRSGSAGSAGSASSASESVVVSRRETKANEPSGILFNEQGYPMFKIGETDTLTSIASDHLGRVSRWQQIYNMNRDQLQSPDKLQIGMLLKLPADASRVPLIDRTSSLR